MDFRSDNAAALRPKSSPHWPPPMMARAPRMERMSRPAGCRRRLGALFETELSALFVATGTAANALGLALLAPPWGTVFCHADAHINVDECGAPEFFTAGAKLMPLPGEHGS